MSIDDFADQVRDADGQPTMHWMEKVILDSTTFRRLELPPRRTFLHPVIQEAQIILISGPRGLGKTWLALSIADAVTGPHDFGPWKVREAANVLYLDGEMATIDMQNRDELLNPQEARKAKLYYYSDAYTNFLGFPKANLLDPQWRSAMMKYLVSKDVKLFVIDNIASLAGGVDENMKKDWDPINGWLIELRFQGISSMLLHHTNKDGGQRGTSAREDNIDMSILLKQPPNYSPEDGADFIVSFTKTRLPLEDLKLVQDIRFTLQQDAAGMPLWAWAPAKAEMKKLVEQMLDDGISQRDIAAGLHLSPGRVSQIKAAALKEGRLKKGGKLAAKN